MPSGFLAESCGLAAGQRSWNAADIIIPALVVRGGRDFWSRPEDMAALESELGSRAQSRFVTIPDATHYLLLDRPERGRRQFVEETLRFLRPAAN